MATPFKIPDGNVGDLIIILNKAGKIYYGYISINELKILLGV